MCRKYTQLTIRKRYKIELLKQEEHTQNCISEILGRDKSTIPRELRRNKNAVGTYNAEYAKELSAGRCKRDSYRNFTEQTKLEIEEKLIIHWSPEQISAHLKKVMNTHISYELIYQYLDYDRAHGGYLYKLLPHRGDKYKKRNIKSRRVWNRVTA